MEPMQPVTEVRSENTQNLLESMRFYLELGRPRTVLKMWRKAKRVKDPAVVTVALEACIQAKYWEYGRQIYKTIVRNGISLNDTTLKNTLRKMRMLSEN